MSQVAVIGSPPDQLLTHLKAADYTVSVYESFSKYPQDSQDAPVAVFVYGADTGLNSANAVKLLKSNAILLLFSPSNDLLQCIKSEIDTVIDLPRIKLADGVPLIIYRLHATDRFHFVPGFSLGSISEDGTPKATYSELLEYSIKLIAECTSHAREVVKVSDTSSLEPPVGTLYYKTASVSILWKAPPLTIVNWTVNVHCYAANWMPGKDFTSKGGKVYVVMTHTGHFLADINPLGLKSDTSSKGPELITDAPGGFAVERQSPDGGTKQDKTYHFNAALKQVLNLFQGPSDKPKPFQFSAEYSDEYSIVTVNQTTRSTGGFKFTYDEHNLTNSGLLVEVPTNGISVFSGGLAKINFHCAFINDLASRDLPLDLTFGVTSTPS